MNILVAAGGDTGNYQFLYQIVRFLILKVRYHGRWQMKRIS